MIKLTPITENFVEFIEFYGTYYKKKINELTAGLNIPTDFMKEEEEK